MQDFTIIISIIGNTLLGLLVFIKAREEKIKLSFTALTIAIVSWIITLEFLLRPELLPHILVFGRLNFIFGILECYALFIFVYLFPKKLYKISNIQHSVLAGIIFVFTNIILWTNLVDEAEILENDGSVTTIFGTLYPLYITIILLLIGSTLFIIYKKYKSFIGLDKKQLVFLFWGSILALFFTLITNIFLPVLGIFQLQNISPLFTLFFIGFTTYAIIKHRLFDIQIQTQKILNILLPIILTMAVITGTAYVVYSYTNLPRATVGITMVIFTVILYKASEIVVAKTKFNHFLFQKTYRFHNALQQLASTASTITDFEQLVDTVANVFAQQGRIAQFGFVVITDQDKRDYMIYKNTGLPLAKLDMFSKPQLDDWLYSYVLQLAEPLLVDELYYAQPKGLATSAWHELQHQLESLRGGVFIPLKVSHDLVGIIILGSKERALAYTSEDLAVFTDISTPLAVAVTKSILFTQYREKITELSLEKNNLQSSMIELHNMKNEFLTIVDHQFNTPLSVIRGAFSMISDGDVPLTEIQDYVKDINPRIEEFHHIVQGMIEAAHFEGGTANMHFEPVVLPAILAEVIKELEPRFAKHNVTLKVNIDSTIQRVTSDPEKLKFALRHVLENAMFFGAGKTVEIQLTQPNKKDVVLHVRDYGRGFSSEEAKHIGQKFFRGQNVIDFHPNGSGLGIYNARKIIHASGGELTFTSLGINQGSIFTITLPKGAEFFKQVSLK